MARTIIGLLSFHVLLTSQLQGQVDAYAVLHDSLFSEKLAELRTYSVFLPETYHIEGRTFPVILILDGESRAEMSSFTAGFLSAMNTTPQAILIGINNVNRERDFLPGINDGGRATEEFLEFIANELIPHIENSYKSNGFRILYGHSYGGLLGMFAMLSKPSIADAYVCLDPSFWYENNWIISYGEDDDRLAAVGKKLVFVAGRGDRSEKRNGISAMDTLLREVGYTEETYLLKSYPEEHHTSLTYKGLYDALRFIYSGYYGRQIQIYPEGGFILGEPVPVYLGSHHDNIHYTFGDTTPAMDHPIFNSLKPFSFNGRAREMPTVIVSAGDTLNLKTINARFQSAHVKRAIFESKSISKPVAIEKELLSQGLNFTAHYGSWDQLSDLNKQDGNPKEWVSDLTYPVGLEMERGAIRYEGFLSIEKNGNYIFHLGASDGARFFINEALIIDNLSSDNSWGSYAVYLEKGLHPLSLDFVKKDEEPFLELDYLVPGTNNILPIPPEMYFCKK